MNKFITTTFLISTILCSQGVFAHGEMDGKGHHGMMNERAEMMSKCADELEKEKQEPEMIKKCAKMLREQSDRMKNCMKNGSKRFIIKSEKK